MVRSVHQVPTNLRQLVDRHVAPLADDNDRQARFPASAIVALGQGGWLGVMVPEADGGLGEGPGAIAAAVATVSQADPSAAMVYKMHLAGTACIIAAPPSETRSRLLKDIAAGVHLTTLAFSEPTTRSHFWAPTSRERIVGDEIVLDAEKSFVTSAGNADSYVVVTQTHDANDATDTNLYVVMGGTPGLQIAASWDGMGLRGNASSPMRLEGVRVGEEQRITNHGSGLQIILEEALPVFDLGSAAVSLGICRAVLQRTANHLQTTKLGQTDATMGEALPTLRANLARMQVKTDALAAVIDATVQAMDKSSEHKMLRVLEAKAFGAETAIEVTQLAMRVCGGAAFARHVGIERYFRDAQAASVMAPTTDVLYEFIGRDVLGLPYM